MNKSRAPHPPIVVGLPDLQVQLRMVERLCAASDEPELGHWNDLSNLLRELYIQLQHQRQVTVCRFGSKSCTAAEAATQPSRSLRSTRRQVQKNGSCRR